MKKEFEQFMKQRGAWDLFIKKLDRNIDTFFNETDPCDYLAAAFVWGKEFDFWYDLQDEWDKHYKAMR